MQQLPIKPVSKVVRDVMQKPLRSQHNPTQQPCMCHAGRASAAAAMPACCNAARRCAAVCVCHTWESTRVPQLLQFRQHPLNLLGLLLQRFHDRVDAAPIADASSCCRRCRRQHTAWSVVWQQQLLLCLHRHAQDGLLLRRPWRQHSRES